MIWVSGHNKWALGPFSIRKITATVDGKGSMFWLYRNSTRINICTGKAIHYNDPAEECHTRRKRPK